MKIYVAASGGAQEKEQQGLPPFSLVEMFQAIGEGFCT